MSAESVFFLICCTILTCVNLLIFLHTPNRRWVKRRLDTLCRYVIRTADGDTEAVKKEVHALAELYYKFGIKPEELDAVLEMDKEGE